MTITQLKTVRHLGLTLTPLETLLTLAADGDLPMTILAERLGLTTAAITGTADSLAKKGLVKRSHGNTDRRVVWLALTSKGRDTIYQITGRHPELSPA